MSPDRIANDEGDKFKCLLDIVPIKNEKSQVVLILVSHKDIGDKPKNDETDDDKSSSEMDSDEEMAEAYRKCQARRGRAAGPTPAAGNSGYQNQRRRSRAVLYHLSGQFEKHNRANRAKTKLQQLNKFSSISGKMPEYKVQEVKKSKFILVHYGIFKIGWDWLILLCTFYTAILVPYNAAFTRAEKKNRDSIYSDVVVEILFMFDILFNFRTSFVNKSGQVVYDARLIAVNYIRSWFLPDLLAAIPFDFLYIFNINADAPVHLLKVARLIRLARLLQKIDRFSQYSALVLALLMSMFTLVAHWLACIWYAIGNAEYEDDVTVGWLIELSERLDLNSQLDTNRSHNVTNAANVKPDVLMSYLSALYFTCSSLTSVGFGNVSANTNSEKIFSICAMIIGALMHAVVFGNVTALIQRMYQRRANFHSKTKDLKDFFRTYDIPKPLKQRMQEYFQTMWSMNNGIETAEILKDFPEEMKGELGLHLHKEVLNLPIFEEATQGCLKSVALHSRRSFCAPGEFLVHKGDATTYLYLLVNGSMEILKSDMVVAILGKGDLFGSDIDFDDPISVCNYDVRSLTYSELQCINIKGLTDVLLLYPDFAERFAKDIHNDLTYNLRQTESDSDEDTASNPKTRVCTLPSISEDDELSPSDEEDEEETKPPEISEKATTVTTADEDDGDISLTSHSISSPLLPVSRIAHKIPNGDIPPEASHSCSPPPRPWGIRRTSGLVGRSSFKDTRKVRMSGNNAPETNEKVIPHIQNLQNEVDGTKTAICKLERKVSKIGQDICAIDRNMREILKHITNVAKMAPLEPLAPLTPVTPSNSNKSNFSFDFTDMTLNDRRGEHTTKDTDDSMNDTESPQSSENSPNMGGSNQPYPLSAPPINQHRKPSTDAGSNGYAHSRRRSSLQVPLLLNPHELVARRYSDGNEEKEKTICTDILNANSTNSDINFVRKPSSFKGCRREKKSSIDTAGRKQGSSVMWEFNENDKQKLIASDNNSSEFINRLDSVHSPTCRSPLLGRQMSNSCDGGLNRDSDNDVSIVKKSSTFDGFQNKRTPIVSIDPNYRGPSGDNRKRNLSAVDKCNNNKPDMNRHIQLEVLQSAPKLSKSCVEIHQKHKKPPAFVKARSQGFIETEFGAKTPNEVRTVHFLGDNTPPRGKRKTSPLRDHFSQHNGPADVQLRESDESNTISDSVFSDVIPIDIRKGDHHSKRDGSSRDRQTIQFSERFGESSQENLRTDSGNVSLQDTPDGKHTDIVDQQFGTQIPFPVGHDANANEGSDKHPKFKNMYDTPVNQDRICNDVSPDSLTDISESLKTDSLRTDDDIVLDIETDPMDMNGIVLRELMDDSMLKTTNL